MPTCTESNNQGCRMNTDDFYMRCAIAVSEKARLISPPNPWVGCVIVKNNQIIAEGFTQQPGKEHAEIMALNHAGGNAKGSTVYVSLEPCSHYGRTPPCVNSLIKAGVARVVIGVMDPDPLVCGQGMLALKEANIEITIGICKDEVEYSLRSYLYHRRTGKTYCLLKTAVSIDGRIAAEDGSSNWITCEEARQDAHMIRAQSQAIMVGSGTALQDKPRLDVRSSFKPPFPPLRILMDRRGIVPAEDPLFNTEIAPTLVITTSSIEKAKQEAWLKKGASLHFINPHDTFESILSYLGSKGIIQLMVEGGSRLQSSILKEKGCQELIMYIGSKCLGDKGKALFCELPIRTIDDAIKLNLKHVRKIGNSTRLDYIF